MWPFATWHSWAVLQTLWGCQAQERGGQPGQHTREQQTRNVVSAVEVKSAGSRIAVPARGLLNSYLIFLDFSYVTAIDKFQGCARRVGSMRDRRFRTNGEKNGPAKRRRPAAAQTHI
jgi:hypothetical protein